MKLAALKQALAAVPQRDLVLAGSLAAAALTAFVLAYATAANPESFVNRSLARYAAWLERNMRALFVFERASRIIGLQAAGLAIVLLAWVALEFKYAGLCAALVVVGPPFWLVRMRRQRVAAIEAQLAAFVQSLANALRSTPSVGAALATLPPLVPQPLRAELELALKQMRVGSTLDQALVDMGGRIGSNLVNTALSTVLVGIRAGGNLPATLETSAAALREMMRLEGVVRMKTASGKMQLWVLGAFPVFFVAVVQKMKPGYFEPMTNGVLGWGLSVIAIVLWLAAIFAGRSIIRIDV